MTKEKAAIIELALSNIADEFNFLLNKKEHYNHHNSCPEERMAQGSNHKNHSLSTSLQVWLELEPSGFIQQFPPVESIKDFVSHRICTFEAKQIYLSSTFTDNIQNTTIETIQSISFGGNLVMPDKYEEIIDTCKKNCDRNLCWFIQTTKKYHKIAKQQDYYSGPK
ncbi:hypothetical protein [Methanohalophilus sp.]|uniref:hypothetical protein n=1 Tax=Methanohalophilus sp. TaxID=1966352 RepID=UPI002622286F|nr:hypothetical protein [Methanohalophilus sp.]MDK2892879.1 hypothetical protein [Methanohalophilus sp.]